MRPADRLTRCIAALVVLAPPLSTGCGKGEAPDAYGNFETTEVVVSAETAGQLIWFTANDGMRIDSGVMVGVVDTVQLALERDRMLAQKGASSAGRPRRAIRSRYWRLSMRSPSAGTTAPSGCTSRRPPPRSSWIRPSAISGCWGTRLRRRGPRNRPRSTMSSSTIAQIAQIEDHLRRSRIANPRTGTVLTTYVEAGEFVQQGQPLYKLAMLDSMELRAYVTEPQLAQIHLGQPAEVTIDAGNHQRKTLRGKVTWISSEAEFTPTPVQTREERADLVYAMKIVVPNDSGMLKIGDAGRCTLDRAYRRREMTDAVVVEALTKRFGDNRGRPPRCRWQ